MWFVGQRIIGQGFIDAKKPWNDTIGIIKYVSYRTHQTVVGVEFSIPVETAHNGFGNPMVCKNHQGYYFFNREEEKIGYYFDDSLTHLKTFSIDDMLTILKIGKE